MTLLYDFISYLMGWLAELLLCLLYYFVIISVGSNKFNRSQLREVRAPNRRSSILITISSLSSTFLIDEINSSVFSLSFFISSSLHFVSILKCHNINLGIKKFGSRKISIIINKHKEISRFYLMKAEICQNDWKCLSSSVV